MSKYFTVAKKDELEEGKMKEYKVSAKTLVLVKIEGDYLAFDSLCTHAECPLAGGYLDGTTVTCYCHGAQFDISSGEVLSPPATSPLQTYKVKLEGDDILVKI